VRFEVLQVCPEKTLKVSLKLLAMSDRSGSNCGMTGNISRECPNGGGTLIFIKDFLKGMEFLSQISKKFSVLFNIIWFVLNQSMI